MKYCSKCGHELVDAAVVCTACGCSVGFSGGSKRIDPPKDEADTGLLVLCIIIPVVGFILWALKYQETPKAAKTYGIAALIVCGAWVVISAFVSMIVSSAVSGIMDGIMSEL